MNGGAGRVIASIPAFELYEKENPKDDFIIVCEGGTDFYKGHPTLSTRVFDHWHKGLFETYVKDRNCVSPEPYRVWEYYNQKCSLAQAFDIELNGKGIRELPKPTLKLSKDELLVGRKLINEVKEIRLNSSRPHLADIPSLFAQITQDLRNDFILVPATTSYKRKYIPVE